MAERTHQPGPFDLVERRYGMHRSGVPRFRRFIMREGSSSPIATMHADPGPAEQVIINGNRIVDCLNFCEGVSSDALTYGGLKAIQDAYHRLDLYNLIAELQEAFGPPEGP